MRGGRAGLLAGTAGRAGKLLRQVKHTHSPEAVAVAICFSTAVASALAMAWAWLGQHWLAAEAKADAEALAMAVATAVAAGAGGVQGSGWEERTGSRPREIGRGVGSQPRHGAAARLQERACPFTVLWLSTVSCAGHILRAGRTSVDPAKFLPALACTPAQPKPTHLCRWRWRSRSSRGWTAPPQQRWQRPGRWPAAGRAGQGRAGAGAGHTGRSGYASGISTACTAQLRVKQRGPQHSPQAREPHRGHPNQTLHSLTLAVAVAAALAAAVASPPPQTLATALATASAVAEDS